MIRILLKKQLSEILRTMFRGKGGGKKAMSTLSVAMLLLVIICAFGGLFAILAIATRGLITVGLGWLYYTIFGLVCLVMGVIGSVFTTYSALYQAKDNDLLLSMPIPVHCILIARLLGVYLIGLLYSALAFLPAVIVYSVTAPFQIGALLCALAMLLLISFLSLTLSCALGWVIAKISSRLKHKNLITVIVSLAFMGAYFYFYSNMNTLLTDLIANGALFGAKIQSSAYPLYLFGRIGVGDGMALLFYAAIILALFSLMAWLLSRSFLKLATMSATSVKARYRGKTSKLHAPASALLRREFSHYLSSPIYILNSSLGTVFMLVLAVFLLLKQTWLREMLPLLTGGNDALAGAVHALAICLAAAMNTLTAPSVSLEGKTFWLARSLPIIPWQLLAAKLKLHLWLTLPPVLLCGICACLAMQFPIVLWLMVLLLPTLFVLLFAVLGLMLNLKFPNLDWTSEAVPVKQGASVTLTMLGGWVYLGLLVGGYFLLNDILSPTAYALICGALTAAVTAALLYWLRHRGCRILETL